jgi:hypothetical protein
MAFKITRKGPHIGPRLAKKLKTHRWHLLRNTFGEDPDPELQPEFFTYEAGYRRRQSSHTECNREKLFTKAWGGARDICQIMWFNRQNGIQFATDGNGYYFATPVTSASRRELES